MLSTPSPAAGQAGPSPVRAGTARATRLNLVGAPWDVRASVDFLDARITKLSDACKIVLLTLDGMARTQPYAFFRVETLAAMTGKSPSALRAILGRLERAGWVRRVHGRGNELVGVVMLRRTSDRSPAADTQELQDEAEAAVRGRSHRRQNSGTCEPPDARTPAPRTPDTERLGCQNSGVPPGPPYKDEQDASQQDAPQQQAGPSSSSDGLRPGEEKAPEAETPPEPDPRIRENARKLAEATGDGGIVGWAEAKAAEVGVGWVVAALAYAVLKTRKEPVRNPRGFVLGTVARMKADGAAPPPPPSTETFDEQLRRKTDEDRRRAEGRRREARDRVATAEGCGYVLHLDPHTGRMRALPNEPGVGHLRKTLRDRLTEYRDEVLEILKERPPLPDDRLAELMANYNAAEEAANARPATSEAA